MTGQAAASVPRAALSTLSATALAGAALVTVGCATAGAPVTGTVGAGAAAPDTVRGVVAVVGADPLTRVMVDAEGERFTVVGPAADALRRVHGLEVRVDGRVDGTTLTAQRFRVRALDGLPAVDGVLEVEGDAAILVTTTGERVTFAPAPPALRARAGSRVWIAGHAGRAPQAWGVIGE